MYTLKNVKYIKRGRQVCIYHTKFKREKKKKKQKNKEQIYGKRVERQSLNK